ncbi:hypothetical protein [Pedobacter cryotolerans]|uniref:Uncharacterized protein n=1 Tax=Pedobacter cryotolerans TaxID=2571270 RepID=A0A4U1C711_9SPHI|nr:hypothetical protein [Pedobacter cryotolerans]TKC01231.1 hypothetical protein FA045_08275 [Pedobacter cryotolerans]
MGYSTEQREKNQALINDQMANCSNEDRGDVSRQCNMAWANEEDTKALIAAKKQEISLRASDEEMDEIFKNLGI